MSKDQIEQARGIDLLDYLQSYEPASIRKSGKQFCLVEHESLKIDYRKWYWFSHGFGGRNALDFMIKVRGMEFVEAVRMLTESSSYINRCLTDSKEITKVKMDLLLPAANRCGFHMVAYLQSRGIDGDIISRCITEGRLYESVKYHNCVFVGKDILNKPRFACIRGIGRRFMQDVSGSDKRYGFTVPVRKMDNENQSLWVFESAIDALSKATIDKQNETCDAWDCVHRLSLGGTSSVALMQYLKDHKKIGHVTISLDNDDSGKEAASKIKKLLENTSHPMYGKYKVNIVPPSVGKDYNDTLQAMVAERQEQLKKHRQKKIASIQS